LDGNTEFLVVDNCSGREREMVTPKKVEEKEFRN